MTPLLFFIQSDKVKKRRQEQSDHRKERSKLRRSAHDITKKKIAPMWKPQ